MLEGLRMQDDIGINLRLEETFINVKNKRRGK
jgi:hypothetical protein